MIKKYNKLVRDKIPEIIKNDNKECQIGIVDKREKYFRLKDKLKEEVDEFIEEDNLEELADILEVLFSLADSLGYSEDELLSERQRKLLERGSFKKGIILEEVRDK